MSGAGNWPRKERAMRAELGLLTLAAVVAGIVLRDRLKTPEADEHERAEPMHGLTPSALRELRDACAAVTGHNLAKRMCDHLLIDKLIDACLPMPWSMDELRDVEAWASNVIAEPQLRRLYPQLVERLTAALSGTMNRPYRELREAAIDEAVRRDCLVDGDVDVRGAIDEPPARERGAA
jgi:hypothetical protein